MEEIVLVIEDYRVDGKTEARYIHAFSAYEKARAYIRKKVPEYDPVVDDGIFILKKGENYYIHYTIEILLIDE